MNHELFSLAPLRCEPAQIRDCLCSILHTILFMRSLGPLIEKDFTCDFCDVTYCAADDRAIDDIVERKIQQVVEFCLQRKSRNGANGQIATSAGTNEVVIYLHFYEKMQRRKGNEGETAQSTNSRRYSVGSFGSQKNGSQTSQGSIGSNSNSRSWSLSNRAKNDERKEKFGRRWESWQIQLEVVDDLGFEEPKQRSYEREREMQANDLAEILTGTITHVLALCEEKKSHVPAVLSERTPSFPFEIELPDVNDVTAQGVFSSSFGMLKKLLKDSTPTQLI